MLNDDGKAFPSEFRSLPISLKLIQRNRESEDCLSEERFPIIIDIVRIPYIFTIFPLPLRDWSAHSSIRTTLSPQ